MEELNKEGNKAADTVRNLEHRLQVQYIEISSQSYDYEHSQRQQEVLVAEIRDRDEAHQEHLAQMTREMKILSNSARKLRNPLRVIETSWLEMATGIRPVFYLGPQASTERP